MWEGHNENFLYVQAVSVEKTLKSIEDTMRDYEGMQFLFIWDSIAATSAEKDLEGDFNPQTSMAVKPRIFSKAFPKLTVFAELFVLQALAMAVFTVSVLLFMLAV